MDGKEYTMTFYAVESPVMGTRWLPAELFASSISNSDTHTKRFKVTIFMNYYYIIIIIIIIIIKTDAINAFVSDLNGLFHGATINSNNNNNQAAATSAASPMKIKPYFIEDIKILTSPLTLGN
jgi:uncharacterized membrane protein SpoIIM required for sporulation